MTAPPSWVRLCLLPLRWPRLVLVAALLLTGLSVLGWRTLKFEPDVSQLLPADHAHVAIHERLLANERPSRLLWVLLRGSDVAAAVPGVAARLRASPLVAEVAATPSELFGPALTAARQAPLWGLDDAALERLQQVLSPDGRAAAIATLRADLADDPIAAGELARRDPLGLRWLFAGQDLAARFGLRPGTAAVVFARDDGAGDAALLRVTGQRDAYDAEFAVALLADVDTALQGTEHDLFGGYVAARADQARLRADFERASTWSVVAIALYLVWSMRGVRLPLLVQLPAMLAIAWSVPFAAVFLGPLPTVAVAAVAVLVGLGVDFAIHYAARYRAARLELEHAAALQVVQARTVPELLIDMATTAVTFVAIGFGQRGGLAAFGWLLAAGLVASVLVTTTVLPVLLRFVGDRRDPERSIVARLGDRWAATRLARPVAGVLAGLALVVAIAVFARGVPLTADGDALRPADDPVRATRQRIEAVTGFGTIPCAVLWPLARDPSLLWVALHELQEQGAIRFWNGLSRHDTDTGRAAVTEFRARTAGFADAAAAEFAAAGLSAAALRPALDELAQQFAADPEPVASRPLDLPDGPHRIVMVWPHGTLDRPRFTWLEQELHRRTAGVAITHGGPTLTAALEDVLRADLLRASWLALALAVVMVSVWLRSLWCGLLALLPPLFGVAAVCGFLFATGTPLTLVSFVVVPFVLGIGVDEGVHLVGHFRHGAATSGATGVGIVRTSVGTALGFLALGSADSPGLRQLGGLVAIGALASVFGCLFVLAPFLRRHAADGGPAA